jgi:hypothetical protein
MLPPPPESPAVPPVPAVDDPPVPRVFAGAETLAQPSDM